MKSVSRRTLLGGLASAGLFAQPRRIHAAIIAQRGVNVAPYLKELGSSPLVDRIALCDESGELLPFVDSYLGARAADLQRFRSVPQMLRAIEPQLVLVTLEAHRAPDSIQAALEAGCHVAVEKPGCTRISDFDRLVRLAGERKRHLMLALATRLHPAAIRARELLRSGTLGRPYGVYMQWVGDQTRLKNPAYHKSWFGSKQRAGGGKLLFHGMHYVDLIAWITGDRIAQTAALYGNVGGQPMDVEDAATVALKFASGWSGTLNTGYYLDKSFANRIDLWCSRGWLRFDPFAPLQWQVHGSAVQSQTYQDEDLYRLMFANAVRAALGQEAPFVTAAESRNALNAVFTAYRAAETGMAQKIV